MTSHSVGERRVAEVAAAIRFLASAEAGYVTGEAFVVDGGLSSRLAV